MGEPLAPGSILILSKTNYQVWAKRMQLHLEAHDLWEAVQSPSESRKDRKAMNVIFSALPEDILAQLDVSKTSKETWEILKAKYVGTSRVVKARVQALRREYETSFMGEEESVVDFAGKLSKIATQLRSLGENIDEAEVISKLLRSAPAKFDGITSSIEQFGDIDKMPLEEVVGSLKIYEEKLQDRVSRREEQVLLAKALGKSKKPSLEGSFGRARGRGRSRGRGRGKGRGRNDDNVDEERPRDKSKVKCYNCEKVGHFAYECNRRKNEEKAQVAEVEEQHQSTLLMAITDPPEDILLQGVNGENLEQVLKNKSEAFWLLSGSRIWLKLKKE
ncbi:uncharacterized protein LOC144707943 [Wolffia australiana]